MDNQNNQQDAEYLNNDHIKQLYNFYKDFDFEALNLNRDNLIFGSENFIYLFRHYDFEKIKHLRLNDDGTLDKLKKETDIVKLLPSDDPTALNKLLTQIFLYKYCFENKDFLNLVAFFFELVKDKLKRDKQGKGEQLSIARFCDLYYEAQNKDYLNNFILFFDTTSYTEYINLFYDIRHYRETGEDIQNTSTKQYNFNTRNDLKEYTKDFYSLLAYFIDFENKKATPQCFNEYNPHATEEEKRQLKIKPTTELTAYIYTEKPDHINITEHTAKDYEKSEEKKLKHIINTNIKEEAEKIKRAYRNKKIIAEFRAKNPDTDYTDEEILQIKTQAKETTIFNYMQQLGLQAELERVGISYETKKDDLKEITFFNSKSGTLTNMVNIEDTEIYKRYGKTTLALKRFIEAQVITFFRNNNINDLTTKTEIKINPKQFNEYRKITKDTFITKEEIKDYLELLTYNAIKINNQQNKHGNIWKTPEDKINKNNKLDEETKKQLIRHTREIEITFNLIDHFIKIKDPETNQETFFIRLTQTYIDYLKLVYINNYFITDNTKPITPIEDKPNDRTPERASFIKDTILFYLKQDKGQRQELKDNNYTKGEYTTTIGKLKDALIEANKLNLKYLKKDGYKLTIYKPITDALKYLADNKIIELYPEKILTYLDKVKATKELQKIYEEEELNITLKNDN